MKNFTIENETNNITVHGSVKEAEAVADSERFGTEVALGKLAANWPAARLIEIWNSLPGATEVKKFKDRATAVSRIWKAIQTLGQAEHVTAEPETAPVADQPTAAIETAQSEAEVPETTEPAPDTHVAPQTPDVAPEAAPARNKATRAKKAPNTADAGTPREGSKTS
jgi:hypothetical protein